MTTTEHDGLTAMNALRHPSPCPELQESYEGAISALRRFLDALAGANLAREQLEQLAEVFETWTPRLREHEVSEAQRPWGHWLDIPGRGQALTPCVRDEVLDRTDGPALTATVSFGRFFVGENGAAHGGAISLMFDDFLGWLGVSADLAPTRTAYLKVDYRSITPIGRELAVHGRVVRVEGRKRFVRGELRDGGRLCAEAEGLLVELKPGQQ